jgi:hypothetical protein
MIATHHQDYERGLEQVGFSTRALVCLCMVMVLGSVEDEQTFSNLAFVKLKIWNQFISHLDLVVCMYA